MPDYDVAIIGGGAAGFAAAQVANAHKRTTVMINDPGQLPLGGTCVNVGCIPSKILLYQAGLLHAAAHPKFRALRTAGTGDLIEAIGETREMVQHFQEKNYRRVIATQKHIALQEGRARFVDAHTIDVNGQRLRAAHVLIATGARTAVPPIPGLRDVDVLTNANVLSLEKQPESLVVLGGGPLALEFAQIFHRFGTKVTVLQRSDRILTREDPFISRELERHLTDEGLRILTGATVSQVRATPQAVAVTATVKGTTSVIKADRLLLATGLQPNTDGLDADRAGVLLDAGGFVRISTTMSTSQRHIFAAGDVTGVLPLETVAARQGHVAALNMLTGTRKRIDYSAVPHAVFTDPQVASVGITEEQYRKEHGVCRCTTIQFSQVEKAAAIKEAKGVLRMVVDHRNRRVLGVQITGPMAADLITAAVYAIRNRMTIDDIRDTVHVFPTISEAMKKAAQSFDLDLDQMPCCVE